METPQQHKGLNAGDLLHLLEIAVLLISLGVGYAKLSIAADAVNQQGSKLERIEMYLSSRDPDYWHRSEK